MCRYEHLKMVTFSFAKLCSESTYIYMYIYVDYPNSEAFYQGYSSIKTYLNKEIEGFGSVTFFSR